MQYESGILYEEQLYRRSMAVPEPSVHHYRDKCDRRDRVHWGIQEHIIQRPDTDTFKDQGWKGRRKMGGISSKEKCATFVRENAV